MHLCAASAAEMEFAGVRDELPAGVAERRKDDVQQRPEHRLQSQLLVDHENPDVGEARFPLQLLFITPRHQLVSLSHFFTSIS